MIYDSFSVDDTMRIAAEISQKAKPGDIFALSGQLGAGKTAFVKGFAGGLGIDRLVTSPTFTLINEYQGGKMPLYHFDAYRIQNFSEMEDTGYEEYFYGDGVCIIEWAELLEELVPAEAVWINIEKDYSGNEDYRRLTVVQK